VDRIYVLTSRHPGRTLSVHEPTAREALVALLQNSYVLDPGDRARTASHFAALSAVVTRVPVRILSVPHRYETLETIRAWIENQAGARIA
jgi:hypothetical protein